MKIDIDKNVVEFKPESAEEAAKLETLWRLLIDCVGESRKLAPIGEYVPKKNDRGASFLMEGVPAGQSQYKAVTVDRDCRVYCENCNKIVDLKKGDAIPLCCGKLMEIVE